MTSIGMRDMQSAKISNLRLIDQNVFICLFYSIYIRLLYKCFSKTIF